MESSLSTRAIASPSYRCLWLLKNGGHHSNAAPGYLHCVESLGKDMGVSVVTFWFSIAELDENLWLAGGPGACIARMSAFNTYSAERRRCLDGHPAWRSMCFLPDTCSISFCDVPHASHFHEDTRTHLMRDRCWKDRNSPPPLCSPRST